jgi:hypothetical protein
VAIYALAAGAGILPFADDMFITPKLAGPPFLLKFRHGAAGS